MSAEALVTGGGGFLGKAICRLLADRGRGVRSFSRGEYPDLAKLGVKAFRGDLADTAAVREAIRGCGTVFHAGAKAGLWGDYRQYYRANVEGTRNVIAACRAEGVRRLVYTSSPSVVFAGEDVEGGDESMPYPRRFEAHYPATKAEAEKLVIEANSDSLATVSLRPHLIWGPGDNHLLPRLLERRRAGKLRRLSGPLKKIDTVYIDNAAEAHLLAEEKLFAGSPVSGKVYFISNGEPVAVWEMIDRLLAAGGLPPVDRSLSPGLAYAAGAILEAVHALFGISSEPRMTRFLAKELSCAHWFDISAARRDLGYVPKVSIEEGLRRLAASVRG